MTVKTSTKATQSKGVSTKILAPLPPTKKQTFGTKKIIGSTLLFIILGWLSYVWNYPVTWWMIPNHIYACENYPHSQEHKDLKCHILRRYHIVHFKVEQLSMDPDVFQVHQFLKTKNGHLVSQRDINVTQHILRRATPYQLYGVGFFQSKFEDWILTKIKFQESNTVLLSGAYSSEVPFLRDFSLSVQLFTGLDMKRDLDRGEFRGQSYNVGGHVFPHNDIIGYEGYEHGGRRLVTMLVYLETAKKGGATAFPRLGITPRVNLGDAVFSYLPTTDLRKDPKLIHAGCLVHEGRKTVGLFFVRSDDQTFVKKCPKEGSYFRLLE